jgi:hypothetical protein
MPKRYFEQGEGQEATSGGEKRKKIDVKIRQAEHLDMRFSLIVLMIIILSWMRDLPIDLYPGAPPSVQIRGNPATDPLNRGISQQ